MSEEKTPNKEKQPKKKKDDRKIINFRLKPKQEEMLEYNLTTLRLADTRTDYFINKITEDYKTEGKGYKKETPNEDTIKKHIDESNERLLQKLQNEIKTIQIMAQSIANRTENHNKEEKLAKIENHLFSFNGLARLDTYDKLEAYLVNQFPDWESDLTDEKIYYDLVYKFLQQEDVKYNNRTRKLVWSVPDE